MSKDKDALFYLLEKLGFVLILIADLDGDLDPVRVISFGILRDELELDSLNLFPVDVSAGDELQVSS